MRIKHSTKRKVRCKRLSCIGFPNYKVSEDGRVWSNWSFWGTVVCSWQRIKPQVHKKRGHLYVSLCGPQNRRSGKKVFVHILVLTAFVRPKKPGEVCRHFPDPNPTNNRLENLQWGTYAENEADKKVHGTSNTGSRNGQSKAHEDDVRLIRKLWRTGRYYQKELSAMFDLSESIIAGITSGRSWLHVH